MHGGIALPIWEQIFNNPICRHAIITEAHKVSCKAVFACICKPVNPDKHCFILDKQEQRKLLNFLRYLAHLQLSRIYYPLRGCASLPNSLVEQLKQIITCIESFSCPKEDTSSDSVNLPLEPLSSCGSGSESKNTKLILIVYTARNRASLIYKKREVVIMHLKQ